MQLRRLPAARRLLARARELSDDPDMTARIDATEASLRAELGELDSALERCDTALRSDGISMETRGILHASGPGSSCAPVRPRGRSRRSAWGSRHSTTRSSW